MLNRLCIFVVASLTIHSLRAEEPSFDPSQWSVRLTGPGSGALMSREGVNLIHRGYLFSTQDWSRSCTLTLEWQPPENIPADDGQVYGDHLGILIRSNGEIRKQRSFEPANGVVIRIDASRGDVYIQSTKDGGQSFDNYKMAKGKGPLPFDKWHSVKVTDTGKKIFVDLNGSTVLTAEIPDTAPQGKIWGIYNREPVGPGNKTSKLRKLLYSSAAK
jgi:hypothetical protein